MAWGSLTRRPKRIRLKRNFAHTFDISAGHRTFFCSTILWITLPSHVDRWRQQNRGFLWSRPRVKMSPTAIDRSIVYALCQHVIYGSLPVMYQSNRSFNILPPPGQHPGHLNFWKIFVQIPLSPGRKAVQMPPPTGKLPDYSFNFSVAFFTLLKLCM